MISKKGYSPLEIVIAAAILLVVFFVFIYGIIPILTAKELPVIHSQIESGTGDCDEDGVIGITDPCPCVASIRFKQEFESIRNCGTHDSKSAANCPNLCKIKK